MPGQDTSPPTIKMALADLVSQIALAMREIYEPQVMIMLDDSAKPATAIVIFPVGA